ncbi:condensation domain-containing protein [Streptomyces sp. NPDC057217]|uniref:condensation domain-containing protein n=1 Tax=Streptomyces sp. NPDC057217 TaxID=3346054 RepID=UPI00362CB673
MFVAESDRTTADGLPLTGGQSGIWLAQQIEPDGSACNIAFVLRLRGDVDPDRLATAARRAVEEAESLHVRITTDAGGAPRQVPTRFPVDVARVDPRGEADPEEAAHRWMEADRDRPADPAGGPLFAQALLRLADDRIWWYQRYHHLLVDGAGVALTSRRAGDLHTLGDAAPAPDWSLARLVAADTAYASSEQYAADRAHWRERMAGRPEPVHLVPRATAPMRRRVRDTAVLDHGVPVVGSSDRPVTDGSPLRAVQFMVERTSLSGRPIGPDEAITVDEALRAHTVAGAHACRWDDTAGTLTPGKRADLVVLADAPYAVDTSRIGDIEVVATFVDGREATRGKKL